MVSWRNDPGWPFVDGPQSSDNYLFFFPCWDSKVSKSERGGVLLLNHNTRLLLLWINFVVQGICVADDNCNRHHHGLMYGRFPLANADPAVYILYSTVCIWVWWAERKAASKHSRFTFLSSFSPSGSLFFHSALFIFPSDLFFYYSPLQTLPLPSSRWPTVRRAPAVPGKI